MLKIEWWFFVQLANFLILLVLLNYILFRPVLRLFKEREDRINGSLDRAKDMGNERESLSRQIEIKLSEARNKADELFEELNKEGSAIQKQSTDAAKKSAAEIIKKAKEDLEAETRKARESLRKDVETFSKKIVKKMIGV